MPGFVVSVEPQTDRGTSRVAGTAAPVLFVATLAGAILLLVVESPTATPRSYADASRSAQVIDLAAVVSLGLVGVLAWLARPWSRVYLWCFGLAITWTAAELVGWRQAPPWFHSTALALEPLLVPLLLHLALRKSGSRASRWFVGIAYACGGVMATILTLAHDPFRDLDCWRTCAHNPFVIHADDGLVATVTTGWWWFVVLAGVFVVVEVAHRGRSSLVAAAAAFACLVWTGRGLVVLFHGADDPGDALFLAVYCLSGLALVAVAACVAWTLVEAVRTRRSIRELVEQLESTADTDVTSALIRSSGDPTLDVVYWVPSLERYVHSDGRTAGTSIDGPSKLVIERNGAPVGAITHAGATTAADLEAQFGAAMRLLCDNERLRAGLHAQVAELRASRARIVETGDAFRRRVERDLHDGAQQQLLALSFELRLAHSSAAASGDARVADTLTSASDHVALALSELRDLAHGIYPTVLDHAGLAAAIESIRDSVHVGFEVDLDDERFDPRIETLLYLSVLECARWAERREVERIFISCHRLDDVVTLRVSWPAPLHVDADLLPIEDRVSALGGEVDVDTHRIEVAVPCEP